MVKVTERTLRPVSSCVRILLAAAFVCFVVTAAHASVLNDPQMGMEDAGFSSPFYVAPPCPLNAPSQPCPTTITPLSGGGGIFDFFNPSTTETITELNFAVQLNIQPSFSPDCNGAMGLAAPTCIADVESQFSCNNATTAGAQNPFFEFCGVTFVPSYDAISFSFFGTNGTSAPGILPLLPGCLTPPNTPDSTSPINCTSQGHFSITLNYGFSSSGDSGGWSTSGNAGLFGDTTPTINFISDVESSAPEPATALAAGLALLGLATLRRKLQ
jgi:hypothetical protein